MGFNEQPQVPAKPYTSSTRAVLYSAGVVLVLAATAAAVTAVLCTTALSCSVSPLSMHLRGSSQQGSSQTAPKAAGQAAAAVSWAGGSCPVQYAKLQTKQEGDAVNKVAPLLLGGAAASCNAGCQPRDTFW
jgi:hypothetical protein